MHPRHFLLANATLFAALAGCSDYELKGEKEPEVVPETWGQIETSPGIVMVETCDEMTTSVALSNVGTGDLEILDLSIDGDGWQVLTATPFTLEPAQVGTVELSTTGGEADLLIVSDDGEDPELRVPLRGLGSLPPEIQLDDPVEGDIVDVGLDVEVTATVTDDLDTEADLVVSFSSDVEGGLGTATPDADGVVSLSWPYASRSDGVHQLTATAEDRCGNLGMDSVNICQQAGYLSSELDISSWHFEGSAYWDSTNDWLELTSASANQVGTAFATNSEVLGSEVTIRFEFYAGDGSGADGLSMTVIDTSRMTTYLGGTGCGMGYGGDAPCSAGPPLPGWTIEVDTYLNAESDPTANDHVAFTFDGDVDDPAAWASLPEMEDTGWHVMEVEVLAPHVRVAIDGVDYIDTDLTGHFDFPAHVGFTAGTGDSHNRHLIRSLEVTEYTCD